MEQLFEQFKWFGTQDFVFLVIDILLVALIIYRLLMLVKGTRAAQMLVGLLLLLLVAGVSNYLNLYTLHWFLNNFLSYTVIALIVLFQPEIRRALARMGDTPFLHAFTSAEGFKSLDEIVKAAVSISNRRHGALIVIERETDLSDFVDIGTKLDARVSRELILSVFHPSSPIHDGAVVVKGNRIVAAGCFLPISTAFFIRKSLGTRHRAALSITEETDSIAVIVSEETGTISIATAGTLDEGMNAETLRESLTALFTRQNGGGK